MRRWLRPIAAMVWLAWFAMPAQSGPFCGSRFDAAEQMLDMAFVLYGTLYAGGSDELYGQAVSGMGADIDLWRLWNGLADLRFRDAKAFKPWEDWGADFTRFGTQPQDLNWLLHVAGRAGDGEMPLLYRYVAARFLNSLIGAGEGPGWWAAPTPGASFPMAGAVLAEAKPGSLMEWLLVIQSQSDHANAVNWASWAREPQWRWDYEMQALVRERQGGAAAQAWAAAAALIGARDVAVPEVDCTETPAEHALRAVQAWGALARRHYDPDLDLLDALPSGMRRQAMQHLAEAALLRVQGSDAAPRLLADLAARSPDARFAAWLSVGRSVLAPDLPSLIAAQTPGESHPFMAPFLNALSLDALTVFEAQVVLPPERHWQILRAIAARAFVLGRLPEARVALERMVQVDPAIGPALRGPGGDAVQVARALMAMRTPTVWIDGPGWGWEPGDSWASYDLSRVAQGSGALDEALGWWARDWNAEERAGRRGRRTADAPEPVFSLTGVGRYDRPFARLVALDELGRFGRCNGLLFHLNAVLIPWAKAQDAWWRFADREDAAGVLRQLVQMNRWRPGVTLGGKPAAQVAFGILKGRFGDTAAAEPVRFWHFTDIGCRG